MNRIVLLFFLLVAAFGACNSSEDLSTEILQFSYSIPCAGNSWVFDDLEQNRKIIGEKGIKNWTSQGTKIRTYFKTDKAGTIDVGLFAKTGSISKIKVSLGDNAKYIELSNSLFDTIDVSRSEITEPGYHFIEIEGVEKTGDDFPEIQAVLIGGEAASGKVWFAKDDFYWGRRGPSVHLNYQQPENSGDVVYFYNEINVPEGNDVLGSYFMANGFAQGYFGMQVNSPDERRILFSVWSPFKTDNPSDVPKEQRIKLLKKGDGVSAGEFGNEGSGGQSYYQFMWKAGVTYKFLIKGLPTGNDETDFTAWFFAPEVNQWKLIASFRRPKTDTYLIHLYSFLENFYTETGNVTRKGNFRNQWIYTSKNEWIELNKIKFTADATARKESRMDYAGGVEDDSFFLRNCGFFSKNTTIDSFFKRPENGEAPRINFDDLP